MRGVWAHLAFTWGLGRGWEGSENRAGVAAGPQRTIVLCVLIVRADCACVQCNLRHEGTVGIVLCNPPPIANVASHPAGMQQWHHVHVGSGPRKELSACGVQVEPAAWPGPAFGGGPRLRRGRLFLLGNACCSPRTVICCYTAGERHAYVPEFYSCRPEVRRCHCHHFPGP